LHIGNVGFSHFSVRSLQFQLYDFFVQLICPLFFFWFSFKIAPISSWICAFRQHPNHIDNGKIPFFFFIVPNRTNFPVFKSFNFAHFSLPPAELLSAPFYIYNY